MRLARLPLSIRVPLLGAAMMVLVGVLASQQVLASLSRGQDARLRELARLHVDGLSVALGPAVFHKDVWETFDILDRATSALDGQRMILTVVADESGRVVAASDPSRAPVDSMLSRVSEGAQSLQSVSAGNGQNHVRLIAPLFYQGRQVGQILSELDVSDLLAERTRAALYLLFGNAMATTLLAVVGYIAMRRMLSPISMLARQMGRTSGVPEAIPESQVPQGDSELARLFQTYNAMSGAVVAKAEAEKRLAERERFVSLGRLASSLAHEINNPLGGLLNATDTIRAYPDRPDVVRQSVELIDRGLRHLRDVSRATLEHNRVDRQGQSLSPEDMEDLRLLFVPEASRQGQRIDWNASCPRDLLAGFPAAPVRQIALNLLLNASAAAGPAGRVGLSAEPSAEGLVLKVRDNGPGLSEAARQRLLTSDAVQPGGGVGLRLVREMVLDLGGRIEHRRTGDVTEICVMLPCRRAA